MTQRAAKIHCAVLAVDMGGPIFRQQGVPTEGAVDALRELVRRRFGEKVHLISYCPPERQQYRRERFEEKIFEDPITKQRYNFYDWTGVLREHVHFCAEASDKAVVCSKVAATHYVENQIEALKHICTVPFLHLFHPLPEECVANPTFMQYVFDPEIHSESERHRRPIRLEREWTPAFIDRLCKPGVFLTLRRSGRVPLL